MQTTLNEHQSPMTYMQINLLPWIYRIMHIKKTALPNGGFCYCATLFHEEASIAVTWLTSKNDDRLQSGCLVTPRWTSKAVCKDGNIVINRLLPVARPSLVNIFDTVPYEWVNDRALIQAAKEMVDQLPDHFIKLLNGIFWDHRRLYRFLIGPSSLNGHHHGKHGNLRHSIEVTKNALLNGQDRPTVSKAVLIMAALLHDAGKADEYKFNPQRHRFEISTRGALLGHKISIVEWIAAAIAQHQIQIPTHEYLSLMHALTAAKGAPDWVGIREAISPEANLLSIADRLSGQEDLFQQTRPLYHGFGKYHKHLKGRPYLTVGRH